MDNNCIYCGKKIINQKRPTGDKDYSKVYKSSEHIIQNALGGKFESENICCDRCNFHLEDLIDKNFCSIFAPLVSDIKGFKKTNNRNSEPKYSGYAIYNKNGKKKIVRANVIKGEKIKKSEEIIEYEKEQGTKNLDKRIAEKLKETKVIFNDFNLSNEVFKLGLSKIAFNYAIYSGIDVGKISDICNTICGENDNELLDIKFNTKIIPFFPGNKLDEFIELETEFVLFHNLLLFRYDNMLWCYINLFNTFQYYVLLSNDYSDNENSRYKIYAEDFQYIQSNMDNDCKTYKDFIKLHADKYKEIKIDMSYAFYIRENIINTYYRIETPLDYLGNEIYKFILYPLWIKQDKNQEEISSYTTKKFVRLNQYLIKDNPLLTDKDFEGMSNSDKSSFLIHLSNSINPNTH